MASSSLIVGDGNHEMEVGSTYNVPLLIFTGYIPADPASITLVLRDPQSSYGTFTYPVSATSISRNSTGNYTFSFSPSLIGRHVYSVSTTTPNLVSSGYFTVLDQGAN
jgi:hypothetical protein